MGDLLHFFSNHHVFQWFLGDMGLYTGGGLYTGTKGA